MKDLLESTMPVGAQEHLGAISKTLDGVESWEDRLGGLVGRTTDELQDLMQSFASEVKQLKELRVRLQRQADEESESEDASSDHKAKDKGPTVIHRWCTSELKLANWASIVQKPTLPTEHHPAIYILLGDINDVGTQIPEHSTGEICDPGQASQDLPEGRHELPKLIAMRSMRLLLYIENKIYQKTLRWTVGALRVVNFIILRPFKILAFLDDEIRQHLKELEERRRSIKNLTEEEYDDDWRSNPPSDNLNANEDGKSITNNETTLSEFTGLIKDFRSLIRFMDHYIVPAISRKPDEHVYFSDLWYTFPPGSLIYINNEKVPQKIWKVVQRAETTRLEENHSGSSREISQFVIDCYFIDFDGNSYNPSFHNIRIDLFDGCEPVTSLPAFPLQAAETWGHIDVEAMVNRGRDFIECTRPTHRDYTGRNQLQHPNGMDMIKSDTILPENVSRYSEWIDSEVMVDIERALHAVPAWRPDKCGVSAPSEYLNPALDIKNVDCEHVWDRKSTDRLINREKERWRKWDRDHPPTEREDLLLLPGRVFGFVFRTRKWACLLLENGPGGEERLRKRQPRPEPWDELELPDGHKNIVKSLIESHVDGHTSRRLHFDLVRAKGKGVIILLHGVPGVGKTSTAECAAEANNRPLLPITCGDLGTSPKEVETKLQETFQLAQLWNCVLLLDEADVFLAQRNEHDIQRNALGSVFLRVLEYYDGILFLTSNRVGVFDEAFKSRVHMALYYPPLEWKYTKRIWETHLNKLINSDRISLDHKDLLDYAETFFEEQNKHGSNIGPVWNGRQIRNAFQSAVALAGYKHEGNDKIVLTRDHFEKVSKVSNQFNHYLWSIQCKTDSDKAAAWGIRYDQWVRPGMTANAMGSGPSMATGMPMDGGPMTFGLNAAVAGPSYQQQQMTPQVLPQMQGFPPPQQQQGQMGVQNVFQGVHQQGQAQFGQQPGFIQPQHQYSYQAPNQQPQPQLQQPQLQQPHVQQ